jgi:hypothetical protein
LVASLICQAEMICQACLVVLMWCTSARNKLVITEYMKNKTVFLYEKLVYLGFILPEGSSRINEE